MLNQSSYWVSAPFCYCMCHGCVGCVYTTAYSVESGKSVLSLQVRGPTIVQQYFRITDKPTTDSDGWFATGDVASIDVYGHMQLTDRSKDVIKSGDSELLIFVLGYPPQEAWLLLHFCTLLLYVLTFV